MCIFSIFYRDHVFWKHNFTSFKSECLSTLFSCLTAHIGNFTIMLTRSKENRQPCSVPDLRGNPDSISLFHQYVGCGLFMSPLLNFISRLSVFIIKSVEFCQLFYVSIERIMQFLSSFCEDGVSHCFYTVNYPCRLTSIWPRYMIL